MQTWTDEALRALLCEELEAAGRPLRRKQLIERSAARLGERVESDADLRPGSAVVRGKSRLGMLLTELIHTGVISEDAVGLLRVVPGQLCGVSPARVRAFVLAELKKERDDYELELRMLTEDTEGEHYERLAELRSRLCRVAEEIEKLDQLPPPPVTMENLARIIELWTKIPASKIKAQEYEQLRTLSDRLKERIVGQDEAVEAVSRAIRRSRVGISPKKRPVSFIFVGPTGVGKTELVKCLAGEMFDSVDSLIRLDMSEYMEKHTVSKLIGSPPGYVGYDEAGQLTEKIRRRPYSVVLFDEIEKAHPDVLNVLLQVLDDGRITDAQGRVVNFENAILVMTSNAGSDRKGGGLGFGQTLTEQRKEGAMKALGEFLRPEFLNRVDEIISFNHLSEENFRAIAGIMLAELRDSLAERGLSFTWDEALGDYLTKKAYSITYGARNLRRTIQRDLEDPIAEAIIDSFESPISALRAVVREGKLELEKE